MIKITGKKVAKGSASVSLYVKTLMPFLYFAVKDKPNNNQSSSTKPDAKKTIYC